MINDADNEYGRWEKLAYQIRNRHLSRAEFKAAAVGRSWLNALETLSDDAEADQATKDQEMGLVARRDDWEGQINSLKTTVDQLQATTTNLTTEVASLEKQVADQTKQIDDLKAQLGSPKPTEPPVDPIGADTRSLIQKIKDWIQKYILQ